ncbi:phage tail tape measure protein [Comamonas sp. 17RB]|uniref:phage tail tape measure protein n=1 Tax=Comamonas sp. 17RB TaxID=3047025 RepID=UPI0024B678B5|nr:phage tail tape measure protein [Comamonas sp. 17RB]MDI9855207.1 phage tail tape measure protein [Comamonas sp. 17RB]
MADQNMRLRVVLDLVDKAMAPLKRIGQGSKETAATLKAAREQLKQLNQTQKDVGGFREARTGLAETQTKLKAARDQVRQLAGAFAQAGQPTKAMAQQMAAARAAANQLGAQFNAQRQGVQLLRDKLSAAGISTRNLASHDQQLRNSIAATTARIKAQTESLKRQGDQQRKLAQIQQQATKGTAVGGGMAAAGAAGMYVGKRTVQAGLGPVQSFMQHEDAMLGVARQVQGARDEAGQLTPVYRAIEEQVRGLSTQIPLATTEIAEMFTAAARMEVPTDKLSEFVVMASEMATAFDAVPDEITESMGKVAKNFKIEVTNIRGLADTINYLDDNAISKGSDIIDYLNRTSGVLSTVAMSDRNAAALGSTLLTLGERAETASTATNAIVSKFAAATKGTKKFQAAVKEIGLSTQSIETGMTKDATATLLKVMEAVRKAPEAKRMGIMVELVGMEHSDTLAKLVDKPEELKRQLDMANSKDAVGSMAREAAARNAALSAQVQMQKNRFFNAMATGGESLKQPILELFQTINPLLQSFTQWMQANPALVGGILKMVIAGGALMAVMGALLIPLGLIVAKGMALRWMLAQIGVTAGPLTLLRGMFTWGARLLPVLMRFAPVLLRFLGPIGLLITAFGLIYSNWDAIVTGGRQLWAGFINWLGTLWNGIVSSVQGIVSGGVSSWLQALLNFSPLGLLWSAITTALGALGIQVPQQFMSLGGFIVDGLIGGITNKLGALKDTVVGAATAVAGWFKEKLGIASPSKVFTEFGGWISEGAAVGMEKGQAAVRTAALAVAGAALVPVAQADGPIVGPGGPDGAGAMPMVSRGTPMAPSLSAAPAAAGGGNYNIVIHATPGMTPEDVARAVTAELDKRERAAGARRRSGLYDQN